MKLYSRLAGSRLCVATGWNIRYFDARTKRFAMDANVYHLFPDEYNKKANLDKKGERLCSVGGELGVCQSVKGGADRDRGGGGEKGEDHGYGGRLEAATILHAREREMERGRR